MDKEYYLNTAADEPIGWVECRKCRSLFEEDFILDVTDGLCLCEECYYQHAPARKSVRKGNQCEEQKTF